MRGQSQTDKHNVNVSYRKKTSKSLFDSSMTDALKVTSQLSLPEPELVRLGNNAVFKTADQILRISSPEITNIEKTRNEISFVNFLKNKNLPVPSVDTNIIELDNKKIATLWQYIPHVPNKKINNFQLGELLSVFHDQAQKYEGETSEFDARLYLETKFDKTTIKENDKKILLDHKEQILEQYDKHKTCNNQIVHGDFYKGNILVSKDGPVFIDFESFKKASKELDLVYYASSQTGEDYTDFAKGYGYDVKASPLYKPLQELKRLGSTLWLSNLKPTAKQQKELENRLQYWRGNIKKPVWNSF